MFLLSNRNTSGCFTEKSGATFKVFLLLKCFTLQNKAYHRNKTKDDTYNITDTNQKTVTYEQINA